MALTSLRYFAYGSNMNTRWFRNRIPSARLIGKAVLPGHSLMWHKHSFRDGSAKCDIVETGQASDEVYGVLYEIDRTEKPILDRIEERGKGYEQKKIKVKPEGGTATSAFTYYAIAKNKRLKPYGWYKNLVLAGAREHNLPKFYLESIEQVSHWNDSERERQEHAWDIIGDEP
ncbi:MAG: gamma-glutamylcyclotransferase family protein [Balneolaceae bacterium]|nr:gamma-glutamylcyclotransferase family protein [Balneolaceae bacterium]